MTFRYSDAILPFVQARYTLRPSQVWLLLALRRVDEHQTVQSLADSAGVFRTIALGAAASLAAEGLVKRRRSQTDGRRLVLTLTTPAKRMIDTQGYGDRLPNVEAVFRRLLASDLPNLTLRQLWVLFWLHERATDDAGPACISALAAGIMKVERTVVSRITAALSDPVPYVGRLIHRDAERGDRRAIPLSLTAEGRRWVESLMTDSPT